MGCGVVDRGSGVPLHVEFAGNIDQEERADSDEEQIPESGDPAWVIG